MFKKKLIVYIYIYKKNKKEPNFLARIIKSFI